MRGFAGRARAQNIDTPSSAQVARGLSTAGAGQWRRYRTALEPVLPVLAPFVARFGYPRLEDASSDKFARPRVATPGAPR